MSTFYFDEAGSGFLADVRTFFDAVKALVPAGVVWTFPSSGDLIDVATGGLSGTWADAAATPVSATGAGVFALGVGARATWLTNGIRNGRRVKGSTFVVPLISGAYEGNGTILTSALGTLQAAAQTLVTSSAGEMRVYSQPGPGLAGQSSTVLSANVPDAVSWLRSRRT